MKDFVELSKARRDGVPDVVLLDAHSGRGCKVSNLGSDHMHGVAEGDGSDSWAL